MFVKDAKNNKVCEIDENSGDVFVKYKGFSSKFNLSIGNGFIITRNGVRTEIYRKTERKYEIKSSFYH